MHHVLAASLQMHEVAKYYPMTSYDKKTAEQAGIFAAVVGVGVVVLKALFSGGRRKAAASR